MVISGDGLYLKHAAELDWHADRTMNATRLMTDVWKRMT
jgi:hypothetical protein